MKNTVKNKSVRGFTLIEMLTVIAIIGALVGISVPVVGEIRKNSQATATAASINNYRNILQSLTESSVIPLTEGIVAPTTNTVTGALFAASSTANLDLQLRLDSYLISLNKVAEAFKTPMVSARQPVAIAGGAPVAAYNEVAWDTATQRFNMPVDAAASYSWANTARLESAPSEVALPVAGAVTGRNYLLDGNTNLSAAGNGVFRVQYAVLPNVTADMAFRLAKEINGEALMDSTTPGIAQIRGKCTYATPALGLVTVFVYLNHM
jgi:prepilin-type N-terminal cleavage/methylation domain-containing protein